MASGISKSIKGFIEETGNRASLLILVIIFTIVYEVIARYLFNAPTTWVWLVNKQVFGVYALIAGSYALVQKTHIRIDMFHEHFPPAAKGAVRWLTLAAAVCFLGTLVWKGYAMGIEAWQLKERATGVFQLPLYPLKMLIPAGALLFLLGCFAVFGEKR